MNIEHVAVQLYTLRDLTSKDMLGTLRQLASIGYRAVELAGYGDATPETIRATLDEVGMRAISAHVQLERIEQDTDQVVQEMQTLGCEYLVVPWLPEEQRGSQAKAQTLAERLNRVAPQVTGQGLRLAYHNHDFEFAPVDGTTMWDVLIAEADPAVEFELDVYWAAFAKRDPIALIKEQGSRIALLHLKDQAADTGKDAPVGDGVLPWSEILAASNARWLITEQDHPRDPIDDVTRSLRYLEGLK
ncbi:MAG TPA: sugar phosphate isomerase/epimerase [Herpetosiphonaceae bacterium]